MIVTLILLLLKWLGKGIDFYSVLSYDLQTSHTLPNAFSPPRQAARAALGLLRDFIYARQAVEISELLLLSFTMSRDVP